jgi:hypothetical protein
MERAVYCASMQEKWCEEGHTQARQVHLCSDSLNHSVNDLSICPVSDLA